MGDLPSAVLDHLPTPTAGDARNSGSRPETAHSGVSLTDVMVRGKSLPTPNASESTRMSGRSKNAQGGPNLTESVLPSTSSTTTTTTTSRSGSATGGYLHPRFTEAMMGFPPGWTDLDEDD